MSYNDIPCGTTTHNSHVQVTHYNDDCFVEYVTRVNGLDVRLHDKALKDGKRTMWVKVHELIGTIVKHAPIEYIAKLRSRL